ncbi:hypothetical protein ACLOJK_026649 [Asimina triloba]
MVSKRWTCGRLPLQIMAVGSDGWASLSSSPEHIAGSLLASPCWCAPHLPPWSLPRPTVIVDCCRRRRWSSGCFLPARHHASADRICPPLFDCSHHGKMTSPWERSCCLDADLAAWTSTCAITRPPAHRRPRHPPLSWEGGLLLMPSSGKKPPRGCRCRHDSRHVVVLVAWIYQAIAACPPPSCCRRRRWVRVAGVGLIWERWSTEIGAPTVKASECDCDKYELMKEEPATAIKREEPIAEEASKCRRRESTYPM